MKRRTIRERSSTTATEGEHTPQKQKRKRQSGGHTVAHVNHHHTHLHTAPRSFILPYYVICVQLAAAAFRKGRLARARMSALCDYSLEQTHAHTQRVQTPKKIRRNTGADEGGGTGCDKIIDTHARA